MKKYLNFIGIAFLLFASVLVACSDDEDNTPVPEPEPLNNQFRCLEKTLDVASVLRLDKAAMTQFYLSPTAGITTVDAMVQADDYLLVTLPTGRIDLPIDLGETGVTVSYKELKLVSGSGIAGSMKVSLSGETVEIDLAVAANSQDAVDGKYQAECKYQGAFTHQLSENLYTISFISGDPATVKMASAFRTPDAENKAVMFALGSVKASTPEEMSEGDYTLIVTIPEIFVGNGKQTFKAGDAGYKAFLIDNKQNKYESLTSGELLVKPDADNADNVYMEFRIIFGEGAATVEGDFYGSVTDVEIIDILPATNKFILDSPNTPEEKNIIKLNVRERGTNMEFGFRCDEWNENFDFMNMPVLTISKELIGKKNIDLFTTKGWQIYYRSFQVHEEKDPQWAPVNGKGTLSVEQKENGNYRINFKVTSIPSNEYGIEETLELSYEGPVSE